MTTIYTNKKDLPKRKERDVYPTEHDLIKQALYAENLTDVTQILDIGAGDGRWGSEARIQNNGKASLWGIDLAGEHPEDFDFWEVGDFLQSKYPLRFFDLVISNPPYYISEQIIRKAWELLAPKGRMIFLLPLQFMAGIDRANNLWQEIHPWRVGIVSRRPSFYDRGTNGTDYGVYYWKKDGWGKCVGEAGEWKTFLLLHDRDPLKKIKKVYVQKPSMEVGDE
jgi:SAM-dependent methyltransferase